MQTIAIDGLGSWAEASLVIRQAISRAVPGASIRFAGLAPDWDFQLTAWCREEGHALEAVPTGVGGWACVVTRGTWEADRWRAAQRAGPVAACVGDLPAETAPPEWGLAARGALVEPGSPPATFVLSRRVEVWSLSVRALYAQAVAAQWDADKVVDWSASFTLPNAVEQAVAQVLTYLIENENAALTVPARHLGQVHPHFREVRQLLALQCADEARHLEVFTRRLLLRGQQPRLSTSGGQASLQTLLQSADFSSSALLLGVMGEGSFVNLLRFLSEMPSDPIMRTICRLAAQDEARHVAFGMAHLEYRIADDPGYLRTLRTLIEHRHDVLARTSGLNQDVLDSLAVIAGGGDDSMALARGASAVRTLQLDMAAGRRARLEKLGFGQREAKLLADLHTRNFM